MKQNLLRTGLMLLAMIVCAGIGRAQDVFDFSTLGYSNGTEMTEEKGANSTLSFSGEGASNKTVFNGGQVRWYQDNAITVAANDAASAVTAVALRVRRKRQIQAERRRQAHRIGRHLRLLLPHLARQRQLGYVHPPGRRPVSRE